MSLNQKAQDFAKLNLNYVVPTEGDGNCFFRAVSEVASAPLYQADIQEPMKTFCRDHLLLREAVTVWLANMYVAKYLKEAKTQTHYVPDVDDSWAI